MKTTEEKECFLDQLITTEEIGLDPENNDGLELR